MGALVLRGSPGERLLQNRFGFLPHVFVAGARPRSPRYTVQLMNCEFATCATDCLLSCLQPTPPSALVYVRISSATHVDNPSPFCNHILISRCLVEAHLTSYLSMTGKPPPRPRPRTAPMAPSQITYVHCFRYSLFICINCALCILWL